MLYDLGKYRKENNYSQKVNVLVVIITEMLYFYFQGDFYTLNPVQQWA